MANHLVAPIRKFSVASIDAQRQFCSMAGTMKGKRNGTLAQGIAVQLALAMMSTGKARSKTEAAELAGVSVEALKPARLAQFATRNPVGKSLSLAHARPDLLEITTEVDGKAVSAREALSGGVAASIKVLQRYGKRLGKLTKAQRLHVNDAKRWLEMSRSCGLFAPSAPLALPAELHSESTETAPESESVPGALDEFTDDEQTPLTDNE